MSDSQAAKNPERELPEIALRTTTENPDFEGWDLDVVRGWVERRESPLSATHALPMLARLVCRDELGRIRFEAGIHGLEVYVGRYHAQHGPVDVVMHSLRDSELYRMAAPHVRITMSDQGKWTLRALAPTAKTFLNGELLSDTATEHRLKGNDVISLGCVNLIFETIEPDFDAWYDSKRAVLGAIRQPSLFLKRGGDICGAWHPLDRHHGTVVGRSFPLPSETPDRLFDDHEQPDWNLAGVGECDRKFVAYRHALMRFDDGQWYVEPISARQKTYVNRVEILGTMPLMPGDEIALGSLLIHFHHPASPRASSERRTLELPSVVNWGEEHPSDGAGSDANADESASSGSASASETNEKETPAAADNSAEGHDKEDSP